MSYAKRVKADIARWTSEGMIDAATAARLGSDVDRRARSTFGFGGVLALLASLLFAAALLLLVAANWEAIPRLVRVAGLFGLIVGAYVAGALLKTRGHEVWGEAAWLVGAGAWGGSIALVGQMYHLAGTESDAMLVWCVGTGLAAAVLRSNALSGVAAAVATGWLALVAFDYTFQEQSPHLFVPLAAMLWAVSLQAGSPASRNVLLVGLHAYLVLLAFRGDPLMVGWLIFAGATLLFALLLRWPRAVEGVTRVGNRLLGHALFAALVGLAIVQVELVDTPWFVLLAALTFAVVVGALMFAGRDSRTLRRVAYAGFAIELAFVYTATVGTMLDTVGFFLSAALLLGLLALAVMRFERRIRAAPAGGEA